MAVSSFSSLEALSSLVAMFLLFILSISLSVSTKRLPMSKIKEGYLMPICHLEINSDCINDIL